MEITVKVFPTLKPYLSPEWAALDEIKLHLRDLPGETKSVRSLIRYLRLPENEIGQIILNGTIKWDKAIELQRGDRVILSIFIGGG